MSYDYELIILGGGISGLGVALAATDCGMRPLILEAHSVAAATSNNTLRIIHGGFRYLQKLQIPRVIRSLNDQSFVATHFSDAVASLPCLMPLHRFGLKSRVPVTAAAMLYGTTMKLARSPLPTPSILTPRALQTCAPQLTTQAPYGALCWHDYVMTDPSTITSRLIELLTARGTTIQQRTAAYGVKRTSHGFTVTTSTGQSLTSRYVVNTLGPWLHSIELPDPPRTTLSKWCLGFNITISRQIHPTHAIAIESPDKRLFFAVPRDGRTTIGTWYIPHHAPTSANPSDSIQLSSRDLHHFISSWNSSWPEQSLSESDIIATDTGILPMHRNGPNGPELYGSEILGYRDGYCEVLSTKYTTFRSQGTAVLRAIATN